MAQRREKLRAFREFLTGMRTKISFSALSLQEILQTGSDDFSHLIHSFLPGQSLPEAYQSACTAFFSQPADREMAAAFFSEFGRADLQNQLLSIDLYTNLADKALGEASEALREKAKVNLIFSSFLGIAVVLILI